MTASLPGLQLERPTTIEAAIAAKRAEPDSRFLAGGTDLLVNMRRGIVQPKRLIDLTGIESLKATTLDAGTTTIGAGVTVASLAGDAAIAARHPALAQAAASVAGPGHRNVATVGGNLCLDTRCVYYDQSEWWRRSNAYCLKNRGDTCHVAPRGERCHAAFSGDLAPALLALGAQIDIAGAQGARRIALADLYVEDGRAHLTLAPGEILTAVHLPARTPPSAYEKVRVRGAIDYPLAGVAVALHMDNGAIAKLRIGLTGLNSRPFVLEGTDGLLGKPVDETTLTAVDKLVQHQAQPMRTTLAASNYRRLAAAAVTRRLLARLAGA